MANLIKVSGDDEKQVMLTLDEYPSVAFTLSKNISAQQIFDVFQYSKGETYNIVQGEHGMVPEGAFEAFYSLIEDIVSKINSYETRETSEEQKETNNVDNKITEEVT